MTPGFPSPPGSAAPRLDDVAVIEPAGTHYYQPLWTLVGATAADVRIHYDHLVVCPGIQLDWDTIPGMRAALDTPAVSSNYPYTYATAPKTWDLIRTMTSCTAVFPMPAGPLKCAGGPQKIAYLAADYSRQQGVLDTIRVVLVLPTPAMFGVKVFADELERVVTRYGIEVHKSSEVTSIDPDAKTAVITDDTAKTTESISYDLMHVVPPQSAPDWIKKSPWPTRTTPLGTCRSIRTPCSTPGSRMCSPSATPGHHRTPRLGRRSANRPPWWSPTCRPASPANPSPRSTTGTRPAR